MRLLAILSGLLVASCNPPDVIVTDATGAPIEGAAVEPVSLSINHEAVITDAKGEVRIGAAAQPIKWVNVRKAGFSEQKSIDYTAAKPIRVTLKP